MKNILKYTAVAAAVMAFASCEELPDYTTHIDAAGKLAYVNSNNGNTYSTLLTHRPTGTEGNLSAEFQIHSNTILHPDVTVGVAYDASLVSVYNEEHGTSYVALPEGYLKIENASTVIPENATVSRDTVRLSLAETADLSQLTEREYLAPLKIVSTGLESSRELGNVWVLVYTEVNLLRPISSLGDLIGFEAVGTDAWTANCTNYENLFDHNNSTTVKFNGSVIVDMKNTLMVTGLRFGGAIAGVSIEYSEDGTTWKQAGSPEDGYYVTTGGNTYVAFYDYLSARYIKVSSANNSLMDFGAYMIESSEPMVYAVTGNENVVTAKIVHKKGVGSTSDLDARFNVYATVSSETGYTVSLAVDNSLATAYNTKHGTSYKTLPSSNVSIENASLDIPAKENKSAEQAVLKLTGDLSQLNAEEGYIIPVRISSSNAAVSESRGVVYAVLTSEINLIKAISSSSDLTGYPTGSRATWSADCNSPANLFDSKNNTSVDFKSSGNDLTVNMGSVKYVTGLYLVTNNISNLNIRYSKDGSTWKSAGTVASGESVYTGSSYSKGDYYVGFAEILEAQYLRLTFGFSGYYAQIAEFSIYEVESATEPTVYTLAGSDNIFTGKITHHAIAGSSASLDASFDVRTSIASDKGYSVKAEVDNSLVASYNSAHGTKYIALDASYVQIDGSPCEIAAGALVSAGKISISLTCDVSKLKNTNGYILPVKISADGAATSSSRGVVYVVLNVETSTAVFRSYFDPSSIAGAPVADRSAWTIVTADTEGIYTNDSGQYPSLFDGKQDTYVRTWGGPVSFTVDMGQEYDMTGCLITARSGSYSQYQPKTVLIMGSTDGRNFTEIGTAESGKGTMVSKVPTSYVSMYGSQKVRYLKIEISYGSNMGTAEFNIYAK